MDLEVDVDVDVDVDTSISPVAGDAEPPGGDRRWQVKAGGRPRMGLST
ncbi:hypothetical protein ACH4U5_24440 [Streptomyces sp. NPDC020858]